MMGKARFGHIESEPFFFTTYVDVSFFFTILAVSASVGPIGGAVAPWPLSSPPACETGNPLEAAPPVPSSQEPAMPDDLSQPQSSALPDNAAHCPDAPPAERRSAVRPSGLPIFSTEPLTTAEKALLQLTARAHRRLVDALDQAVAGGRVDRALFTLQEAARLAETDARIALLLGSNR